MKSQWKFCFEGKGVVFDKTLKYEAVVGGEQAEAFGFAPEEFKVSLLIESDPEPRFQGMQQTGSLKITLPGDMDQTKDLAYWLAHHLSETISFSAGELKLLGGLITGEYLPDTPAEEIALGEERYFMIVHIVEASPTPTFDASSLNKLASNSGAGVFVKQYNAALKAGNSIDVFLGLFKILEDLYGPKANGKNSTGKKLADALKESNILLAIATTHLEFSDQDGPRKLTREGFSKFVGDLVNIRHNCAHLKTSEGFGIPHGDPRVRAEVEPLIGPLETLAYQAIRKKLGDQEPG